MESIRVLHVTRRHAKADGGITTVINDLSYRLGSLGVHSTVLAATDKDEFVPECAELIRMGEQCNTLSSLFSTSLKVSIRNLIWEHKIDVMHIHGVWMPLQIVAARVARELNIPFVVTAHGMLEPWYWRGKGLLGFLKKKLYFACFTNPVYRHAEYVHAITPIELSNLKILFPGNKFEVIPNAIDLSSRQEVTEVQYEKNIFFIGRVHPAKGIDTLLEAFCDANLGDEWTLVIAGPEQIPDYAEKLREFVNEHGMELKVKFLGPVYGQEKEELYKSAWITVIPSFVEAVGMVNLEASSFYCPTITTKPTGLWDWEEGGGILIEPDVSELATALKEVTEWEDEERQRRGLASYALVKNKYSWDVVGNQWLKLYSSLMGKNLN